MALVPPSAVWGAWGFDPLVVGGLLLAGVVYAHGWRSLRRGGHGLVRPRQALAFYFGLVLLVVAVISPLDALAGTLLSAHMAQHLILLVAAPPLLIYGRPGLVLFLGLPASSRSGLGGIGARRRLRTVGRVVLNPLVVLVASVAALWGWHLSGPYQAALTHPALHAVEHLTFFASALAFWALIIDPAPRRRLGYGPAILLVFVTMLAGAALGAVITFSSTVLYPVYGAGAALWGKTPLADQQLAGALMWIPPGAVEFLTIIFLALRWFEDVDRRVRAKESAVAGAPAGPARPFLPSAEGSAGTNA